MSWGGFLQQFCSVKIRRVAHQRRVSMSLGRRRALENFTDMPIGAHRGNTRASSVITGDGRDLFLYCNGKFARI
jgi:hypothetical protein